MPKRRSSILKTSTCTGNADAVVAATAGEDSWKTWAGRLHGSSDFEWMDLLRGSRRTLEKKFLISQGIPPKGSTTCPVCFCEPDKWHVTSSCLHAVCLDCLRAYAASQIKDPLQSGPLKCPVCPQFLRRKDAVIAMQGNAQLINEWDEKIRNQLLIALPSYRPCPNCTQQSNNGGGFVTPECLAPQYQERQEEATSCLEWGSRGSVANVAYLIALDILISMYPSQSPRTDLFCMFLPLVAFFPNLRYIQRLAAQQARQSLFRPISVECPCCDESFLLPASSTKSDLLDAETKQWINRNARNCPSCSVLISKHGGCNHMHCPNCHASFCWACMQLRTNCRAYQCQNGARYGDAPRGQNDGTGSVNINVNINVSGRYENPLLSRIDSILSRTGNQDPPYSKNVLVVLFGLVGRHFFIMQCWVEPVMSILALFHPTNISSWLIIGLITWNFYRPHTREATESPWQRSTATNSLFQTEGREIPTMLTRWREEEMIREALRRSLQEQ